MPDWLLVLLVCVATYRLTRLLALDEFPPTAWMRDRVERRFGADSSPAYLVHCPWCVSVYVGAAVVLATDAAVDGGLAVPALVWGAASAVSGLLAAVETALNPDEWIDV